MSQQEFVPGSQSHEQDPVNEDDEIYYPHYPYSWSGKLDNEAVPRDEPPGAIHQTLRGDIGDDYEQGYRPQRTHNAGQRGQGGQPAQGVPSWARPQQHRRSPFRFGFILLILLGIALIQVIMTNGGAFVGAAGDVVGAIFGLLVLVMIVPLIILVVFLGFFLRLSRPAGRWYGYSRRWYRRNRGFRRGPFWW